MAWINALFWCLPTRTPPSAPVAPSVKPDRPASLARPAVETPPRTQAVLHKKNKSAQKIAQDQRDEQTRRKAWENWEKDYSSGNFDLEHVPPPACHPALASTSPSSPSQPIFNLFPPYSPPTPPSSGLEQRIVNKLEIYNDAPAPSRSPTPPPIRPRKSSKRALRSSTLSLSPAAHLPTPPTTPPKVVVTDEDEPVSSPPPTRPSLTSPQPSSSSFSPPTLSSLTSTRSLIQHPLCKKVVASTLQAFSTTTCLLSVMDGEKLVFLATSGVEEDPVCIPRQASFCAHTLANGGRGFVVLDSLQDWRFANSPLAVRGVRFYAGTPIYASLDLRNPTAEKVAIGTLCLTDSSPKESFSQKERAQLAALAASASTSIDTWAHARLDAKIARLDAAFEGWKLNLPPSAASSSSLPPVDRVDAGSSPPPAADPGEEGAIRKTRLSLPSTPHPSLPSSSQALLDTATQTIASTLSLPLVYIVSLSPIPCSPSAPSTSNSPYPPPAISPPGEVDEKKVAETFRLSLLSLSRFPPSPPHDNSASSKLGFSIPLHLAALSAVEGGILYERSPSSASSPTSATNKDGEKEGEENYSGGILLAVPSLFSKGKKKEKGRGGVVLAVFKKDETRVWGKEELGFLRRFVERLGEEELV
ncbi:hypothetical protein JCM8547_004151 [Rhodosporidiobolus lusitaniae]